MRKQLIVQVIKFSKISSSRGVFNPKPPLAHALAENILYELSAFQVSMSEENTINATTQQFTIAIISGCALKQGSKTLVTASEQSAAAK